MANEDREWDGGEPESRGDGDAADDDDDEMTPSEASEPEPSDDDSDDSSRRPRILRARAPWRKGGKGKLRAKRRHTLPPRPIPGQRVTEDGERFTFAGIDDPVARKRERDRLRSRSRALKKKLAEQHPPPPPLPASNIPPDTQHNTNFVSFIGSAILAHPLRCAPVGFITQWLQAACPERWGDNAKERRPNWKSAVSSVLSQYECFEKREAYFTDDREKPANFWSIRPAHLVCWHLTHHKTPYALYNYDLRRQSGTLKHKGIPLPEPWRITPRGTYLTEENKEEKLWDPSESTVAVLHAAAGAGYWLTLAALEEEESEEEVPPPPTEQELYQQAMAAQQAQVGPGGQPFSPVVPPGAAPQIPSQQQLQMMQMQHPGLPFFPPRPRGPRRLRPFIADNYYPRSTPAPKQPDWSKFLREGETLEEPPPEGGWSVPMDEYVVGVQDWGARNGIVV